MIRQALLVIASVVTVLHQTGAQTGGGLEFRQPPMPSAKCEALKGLLDDLQKRGRAIGTANERKANVRIACRLFLDFLGAATRTVKALETDGAACGAPSQVQQQIQESQTVAQKVGQQVCDAASQQKPFLPYPPVMDDQLLPAKPMPRTEPWPTRLSASVAASGG